MDLHQQLVKECLKGKPAAQKALYDLFAPNMLGLCYRYTKSMDDAQDVLQEGFVRVFRFLHQYREAGDLGAWIRRIMVNSALSFLKKHRNYQQELVFIEDKQDLHVVATDNVEVKLRAEDLAKLIRQLPIGYQTIFNLHAVEGYTHPEIGKMLGIEEGTSRSQYARARKLLMQWIQQSDNENRRSYAQ